MELWTALSIGLLGSLHCIGMCGPIALALPLKRNNPFSIFCGIFIYNFGRIVTYFFIGLLFGTFGKGIAMAGFQQTLSITVGALMILSVLFPLLHFKNSGKIFYQQWLNRVKSNMATRFSGANNSRRRNYNLFVIGILNGLLPCGLVYMALAGSLAMATTLNGGFFMIAFGLGTIPLMLFVGVYGNQLQKHLFQPIKKLIPIFIVAIGCLFVLRGLNLGIPYISPQLQAETEVVKCE